ncbi:MAG: S8 family peptidase [Bdellovibrionales bacterium]
MNRLGMLAASFLFLTFTINTHATSLEHRGYLIKLKNTVSAMSTKSFINSLGVEVESEIPELQVLVSNKNPLVVTKNSPLASELSQLIEYVEPNYVVRAGELEFDPTFLPPPYPSTGMWGLDAIKVQEAWEITRGSRDITVAISDTGMWTHGDLMKNFWKNPGEMGLDTNGNNKAINKIDDDQNGFIDDVRGWNFEGNINNPIDTHYHGTHVGGTVGAVGDDNNSGISGVSGLVSLIDTKFLDRDGSGTIDNGIKTVLYAARMGAKAVNCSWGGDGYSQTFYDAIEYAKNKGTIVVTAAGNSSSDNDKTPSYPASYNNENIISVAALDSNKQNLTWFSSKGATTVDIAAPGIHIYSTYNPTHSQLRRYYYEHLAGTSMAAPHVTGTIALMYSANPQLNWKQVKDIILATAIKAPKLEGKVLTGGYLNTGAAVKAATATP